MMHINSDTANKLVRQLNDSQKALLRQEESSLTYSFLQGEDPYIPTYDFMATQAKLERINTAIVTLKHAINSFNSTTVLPGTQTTIDMALIRLPMLTSRVKFMEYMYNVPEKIRTINAYAKAAEYTCRNYSADEAKAAHDKANAELMALQEGLNTVNLSTYFDVDIDLTDLL